MKNVLVFGLSGQVGAALLAHGFGDARLLAVSRRPREAIGGVTWRLGSLEQMPDIGGDFDVILGLGPLDAFARWFDGSGLRPRKVIALGSTSVNSRADSSDAGERAQAACLQKAEAILGRACAMRGCALQLLRPTLIYGRGLDHSLSRLAGLARRHGLVLLPGKAAGLRQPVHVDDVAAAVARLLQEGKDESFALDLPGGERLRFDEMLSRVLAVAAPRAWVVYLPAFLIKFALRGAAKLGVAEHVDEAFVSRIGRDQVFDAAPAVHRIGWKPRGFQPMREDFIPAREFAASQQA